MKIIKFLGFIRARGAIEPCLFVVSFLIMFPTSLYSFQPSKEIHIFLQDMESIKITRRKEIWIIRRGGQSTKRILRENRSGSLDQIWGIAGYFMRVGSIIKGNGR